ncbi:ABC transporter permease [Oleiagrimonas sp. C23AA]|uniref:ABC transporter permease n=1 Tax=Oleiagrimonas sp. C23AA TaxID=2719047 RepID=UPI00142042B8|nr:ABC transporter permease [Oleiagrimonas sp. C23AA]NII10739.1 ABC transporter permease [Oleiagrimonas sp. C23AA]
MNAAVWRVEWRRLWVRPFAWTLAAATLAWLGWQFTLLLGQFLDNQVRLAALADGPGYTDLVAVPLLAQLAQLALLVVPLMSMQSIAGERRHGTLPLWFGAGVSPTRMVLGKYGAILAWLMIWLGLCLLMPLALSGATTPDWGKLAAATLGLALTLATLAAIGVACSAFASHPALAAAASLVVTLMLWEANRGAQAAGELGGLINWLALPSHLQPMWRGLVSTTDVAWFVIVIVVALVLAIRRVAAERVRG